jgi:hypothetical protein
MGSLHDLCKVQPIRMVKLDVEKASRLGSRGGLLVTKYFLVFRTSAI